MKAKARISLIILAISLLIAAVFAVSASAEADSYIKVSRFNVSYGEKLAIVVAVDRSADHTGLKLEVYGEEPAEGVAPLYTVTESDPTEIDGKTYSVFMMRGVPAKNIYDEYYIKAVSDIGESAALQYSIIEYLYEMLNVTEGVTDVQKTFFEYVMGYGEYAVRVIDEAEPTKYAYAYSDATDFADRLVPLGSSLTPTVSGAYSVLKNGEEVATVAAGEGYTPTEAGAYEFAIKAPEKTVETFEGLSGNFGTSKYTNTKGLILDVDSDGDNDAYIYNQNKTNTDCYFTPGTVTSTEGSKYTFEMDLRIDTLTGTLAFYDYSSESDVGAGTNYAFILSIAADGTVTLQSFDQKQVVEGKTMTAGTHWYHVEITGDASAGGAITLTVNGEAWATVTTARAMTGDSFKILFPKSTSSANSKIYIDNCGVNYYD